MDQYVVILVRTDCDILSLQTALENTDWKADNFSLFSTVNTYAAITKGAILKESLIDSVPIHRVSDQFAKLHVRDADLGNLIFMWAYRMTM
jgi:hypothetical protein